MSDQFCPVCENKTSLAAMEMSPELLDEMAAQEQITDFVGQETYAKRLEICNNCSKLINQMTCAECGCFVQLRARHITSVCADGKW